MVKSMEDQSRTFCAYLRVSTDRQGKSGLGLEAQQASISGFLKEGDRIIGTFLEVESGTKAGRPELHKALARCKASLQDIRDGAAGNDTAPPIGRE